MTVLTLGFRDRKWNKMKLLIKPTFIYTHAATAEYHNKPPARCPQHMHLQHKRLCKHKRQNVCKRAIEIPLYGLYPLLIVLHDWKNKHIVSVTQLAPSVTLQPDKLTRPEWTINSKTFSVYTPFFLAFVGGTATFNCRLLQGSCKAFVWKRSVSNANPHKHQTLHVHIVHGQKAFGVHMYIRTVG